MALGATLRFAANRNKMNAEIAALKNNSQVFDRTGNLASQLAQQEAAIRAKYAPLLEPSITPQNGKTLGLPNLRQNNGQPNILTGLGLPQNRETQSPSVLPSAPVIQNADIPSMNRPISPAPTVNAPPDIGLINRTMQRQAPQGGLISKAFGKFGLSTVSAANTQRQNDVARRLGGQPQQIDFDGLKQKFRGKV